MLELYAIRWLLDVGNNEIPLPVEQGAKKTSELVSTASGSASFGVTRTVRIAVRIKCELQCELQCESSASTKVPFRM
jgi:hypothetical protein